MIRTRTDCPGFRMLIARATLCKIGSQAPHFSLTGSGWSSESRGRDADVCGCMHDILVEAWPDLVPLARIHLSDIDGVPMHADSNGWYWLAGASPSTGHFAQQFHGGNGDQARSPEECLRVFADHVRLSLPECESVRDCVESIAAREGLKKAREFFSAWIDEQRPRWKTEAEEIIRAFGLSVTRD